MGLFDNLINTIADKLASRMITEDNRPIASARAYYAGAHPEQLRVRTGQFNDNIAINFTRLITQRIVSQMFGKGINLDFQGDNAAVPAQADYVDAALDANKQEVLFHRAALAAGLAGTGYLYLMPGGAFGEDGTEYPRAILVDPIFVTIETLPEDFEIVLRYRIEYKIKDARGRDVLRRRVIEQDEAGGVWFTRDYLSENGSQWTLTGETPFVDANGNALPFAPMLHWQNLPSVDSVYGEPDITPNLEAVQDRINFLSSNISKVIRYYAHPQRFAKLLGETATVDIGPDEMLNFTDANGGMFQLDQLGDLAGSQNFLKMLRQAMFDMARVVDIDSLQDKIGTLTNFGLRVLYQDNLAMIGTKRELFGDMVEELSRRIQMIGGLAPVPCDVVWPEVLPVDVTAQAASEQALQALGVLSKQTIAAAHGLDWQTEQQRMDQEQQVVYDQTPAQ